MIMFSTDDKYKSKKYRKTSTVLGTREPVFSYCLSEARTIKVYKIIFSLKSQQRPTVKMFVYKIQVNPIHTILKYGDRYDFKER